MKRPLFSVSPAHGTAVVSEAAVPAIRILIADEYRIFRAGLRRLLEAEPGFEVTGEATSGAEAVQLAKQLRPEILLLESAMPRSPSLEILGELDGRLPAVRTILLTATIDKLDMISALQLGAWGVVLKEAPTELLFKAIRSVAAGQYWVSRDGVGALVRALRGSAGIPKEPAPRQTFGLTSRELEVLSIVVAGYTNKEIAQKFLVSEDTVKHHVSSIFNKVGASNRVELTLFAIHHRLLE
jgi:DNA-binding NarL/FixJ family response regulator